MTDGRAHIDFETRSTVDLKKSGVFPYAEHPNTGIWCLGWRIGAEPVKVWDPAREPFPDQLYHHVNSGAPVVAHNMMFDRTIWNVTLRRLFPFVREITIEQSHCTMARALAVGLPGRLEHLSVALRLPIAKDMEGHSLMMRMSRPRSFADGQPVWWDVPERIDRLKAYCAIDVENESMVDASLPELTPRERRLYEFDQIINGRGVEFDGMAAERMIAIADVVQDQANAWLKGLTRGAVPKITNAAKLGAWLNARGIPCEGVGKGATAELKIGASNINDLDAFFAIQLREEFAKSSTAKLKSGLACSCEDGVMRGLLQYYGTTTSRWAGRLFQPHNIPRLSEAEDLAAGVKAIEIATEEPDARTAAARISAEIGPVMPALVKAQRPLIKARRGKRFVGGDFSNIEGRLNSWFAQEMWKLQAFRDFDDKRGDDLYKLTYVKSFGVPIEDVTKTMRQLGKVEELALGFQGGVGAFVDMGKNYGVKPDDLVRAMRDVGTYEERAKVAEQYRKEKSHRGLSEDQWKAAKLIVNAWRAANPAIVQGWWDIQDAAIAAMGNPGTPVSCYGGRARYLLSGGVLWCQVPSGEMLAYQNPSLVTVEEEYVNARGELAKRIRHRVSYFAQDPVTKTWSKFSLYGGLQCENIISKTARDMLADKMDGVEAAGYPVVLTVHDEIVSEVDAMFGSVEEYEREMARLPVWMTPDFPLAVAAWEGPRYGK